MSRSISILAAALLSWAAQAYEPGAAPAASPGQFIFAWPLGEAALKPRGASTRGGPVVLDPAPSQPKSRPGF